MERPLRRAVAVGGILWCAFGLVPPNAVAVDTPARGSPSRFKKWEDVRRWMFHLKSEWQYYEPGASASTRLGLQRIIAAAAPGDIYFRNGHDDNLGPDSWLHEPFNLEWTLHQGQETFNHDFNRRYSTSTLTKGSEIPDFLSHDGLFFILPVWPLSDYQPPRDLTKKLIFIVGAAIKDAGYKRTKERQQINGQWCTKITSSTGQDEIWIAEDKELCVLQRQWSDQRTGQVRWRIIATRVAEVDPGLWMPVEFEETQFGIGDSQHQPVMTRRSVTRIVEYKFGSDVSSDLFVPKLRPGAVIDEGGSRFRQVSPGGQDQLDEVVSYLRAHTDLADLARYKRSISQRLETFLLAVAVGIVLGLLPFGARWRHLRRVGRTRTFDDIKVQP